MIYLQLSHLVVDATLVQPASPNTLPNSHPTHCFVSMVGEKARASPAHYPLTLPGSSFAAAFSLTLVYSAVCWMGGGKDLRLAAWTWTIILHEVWE